MANPIDLPVGQSVKEEGDKLECEKCKKEADKLFEVPEKTVVVNNEEKPVKMAQYCEGCYQAFWLARGYRV